MSSIQVAPCLPQCILRRDRAYATTHLTDYSIMFGSSSVDTNTVRVVGRLFGLEIKDSSRRNRRFRELITALVDPENPRAYNYALLDLAHLICHKRRAPECAHCPVQMHCMYGTEQLYRIESSESKTDVES